MERFATRLTREADARGVTINGLADLAGVDHANMYRYINGKRPIPSMKVVYELVMALPDTTPETRKRLLDAAILERTADEWFKYLIYEFLVTADSKTLNRVMTRARNALTPDDEQAQGVLQDADAVALLTRIAEDANLAHLRAALAAHLARRLAINTANFTVDVE